MYFISNGVVEVIGNDGEVTTTLSDGSHFGEICLLTEDRRVATIKTVTICDLFSLSKTNFQFLLEEFPEMRCALEAIALHRLSVLGKKPNQEEIRKKGRISTTIPPPHIGKDDESTLCISCGDKYVHIEGCACCPVPSEDGGLNESTNSINERGPPEEREITDERCNNYLVQLTPIESSNESHYSSFTKSMDNTQ